jgi:hypothetical protein
LKTAKLSTTHFIILALLALASQFRVSAANAASNEDFVADQLKTVKWGQYMATNCQPITLADWAGLPTESCTYSSGSGFGDIKVVMLNAGPDRMAKWLLTACADAAARFPVHCAERLAVRIKCQSGNQFPIAGLVDEGTLYTFRDGVTVKLKEFGSTALSHKPSDDEQTLALSSGTVESVKKFARVQGTTRAEYAQSTGHNVSDYAGLAWQAEIRSAYKRAWTSDRNDLLSAWAKANVDLIDHKDKPGAKFDDDCKRVARHWAQWPITGE